MQVPVDPRKMAFPLDRETAPPVSGSRPPDNGTGEANQRQATSADAVNEVAGVAGQQVFVKPDEPLDERIPGEFVPKNNRAAGCTHQEKVRGSARTYPKVDLEDDLPNEEPLRMFQPLLPISDWLFSNGP